MSAAIYTRMSLDRTGKEAGVTRQLEESRALADSQGLDVTHELSDNDISATTGKVRPSFQKLMSLVEKGAVDTVVVWHPDRLYRTLRDLVPLMDLAQRKGLSIVSVTAGEMDLNTPHGRMIAGVLGSIGTHEGEHKAERQKLAYKARAAEGHWKFTHRPFGYQRLPGSKEVEVVPHEAEIIRTMYRGYYEEGVSRYAMAKDLNERGILTTRGGQWDTTAIRSVLGNSHYAGLNSYRGEPTGRGNWEPIITEEEWTRYTLAASSRKVGSTFTRSATSLLSGLMVCGVCGGKVYRKVRGDKRYEYACKDKVCAVLSQKVADKHIRSEVLSALMLGPGAPVPEDESTVGYEALVAALEDLGERRKELTDGMAQGFYKLADIKGNLTDINEKEADLQAQLSDMTKSSVAVEMLVDMKSSLFSEVEGVHVAHMDTAAEFRQQLGERFDALPLAKQRDLVALLMDLRLFPGVGVERLEIAHKVALSLNEVQA